MKRIIITLVMLALLLTLTACGNTGSVPGESSNPSKDVASTSTLAPATPAPAPAPTPTSASAPAQTEAPATTELPDWESLGGVEYAGKARGYGGYVNVTVVLDGGGKILDVKVGQHWESDDYGDKAIAVVPNQIVERQSLDVDAVSGATFTSDAIIKAVAKALSEAGLDPADYGYAP